MKQGKWLLFLLSLVLVLSMSVGVAHAYFTASVTPKGGYVLKIGYTPPIYERLDGDKHVTLTSEAGAPTVFVRAKAYTGTQYQQYLSYTGENWVKGKKDADFFYYYILPLEGGTSTSELHIHVSTNLFPAGAEPGEQVNVIVVYESTPAVFTADGKPDFATAWDNDPDVPDMQQGG